MHFEALKTFRLRMRHCFCKMRWCVRHPEVVSTAILYCYYQWGAQMLSRLPWHRGGEPKGGALGTTHVAVSAMRAARVAAAAQNPPG